MLRRGGGGVLDHDKPEALCCTCIPVQHTDRLQEEKKMKRKEDENLKYQQYLSMVVDYAAKDYTEIEDVISRYRVCPPATGCWCCRGGV